MFDTIEMSEFLSPFSMSLKKLKKLKLTEDKQTVINEMDLPDKLQAL